MPRIQPILAAFLLLLSACRSGPSTATRDGEILARHNFSNSPRLSATPEPGLAPTGVWRIQGKRNTVYLAGTSHLITPEQIPFPSAFYAAYNDSPELCLESNDDGLSVFARAKLLGKMFGWINRNKADFFLPRGVKLSDVLEPATVEKLKAHYGKEFRDLQNRSPLFVAFLAQAQNFSDQYFEDGGVEDVFAARARKDGKPIRVLDDSSVDNLIVPVIDDLVNDLRGELAESGPDALLEKVVLANPEKIAETAWRNGDLKSVEAEFETEKQKSPALFEELGPARNRKWIPKIKALLNRDKNVFILVGCAHLPGPAGLLRLLRDEGIEVTQLHGLDHLTAPSPP